MKAIDREFRDRYIFLSSEIEGGNAYAFKKYPGNIYSFTPIRDPGENYSGQAFYFKFLVENLQKEIANITITAVADFDDLWKGWQSCIYPTLWVFSPNLQKKPIQLGSDKVHVTPRSMSINLTLESFEKLIISNMLAPPYSQIVQNVEDLASMYPTFLRLRELGRSPMGNPIYSVKVNPKKSDSNLFKILVGGSPQPNEFGDYATLLLLQEFLDKGSEYWDDFSEKFSVEYIFFQNPDGMVLGKNMVNSLGENPFFSYYGEKKSMPLENQLVWDYISQNPPNLYLEMHSFFQNHKTIRPYIYPSVLLPEKKAQKNYQKIAKALTKYCNGIKEEIQLNQQYFQDTLCYRLMELHQIYCYQFKLHSGMTISQNTHTAWEVFSLLVKVLQRMF